MSLRPDVHGTDGFFAAIFERKKNLVLEMIASTKEPSGEAFVEASDLIEPEVESESEAETKQATEPKIKLVKVPTKKRVKAQKVEPPKPELDSDLKGT